MRLILFALFSVSISAAELPKDTVNRLANAIYQLEGGSKTCFPYGVKSINTGGDPKVARRICENTIRNNYQRWIQSGKTNLYLDFLANRYCPIASDPKGNINWKKNIKKISGMEF